MKQHEYVSIPSNKIYYNVTKVFRKNIRSEFEMQNTGSGYIMPSTSMYTTENKKVVKLGTVDIYPQTLEESHLLTKEDMERIQNAVLKVVNKLDDSYADILDCVAYMWSNQVKTSESMVKINIDDILELLGKKKKKAGSGRRGGYMKHQRKEILRKIFGLSVTKVEAQVTTKRKRRKGEEAKQYVYNDYILSTGSWVEEIDKTDNLPLQIEIKVGLGDTLGDLFIRNRETALIHKKILSYDPKYYYYEKRIGRYFAYLWRVRRKTCSYSDPLKVGTILDEIALDTRYKDGKTCQIRERFENAMDKLERDGVIGQWSYKVKDPAILEARGIRLKDYRDWEVEVIPPDIILDHYRKIKNKVVTFPTEYRGTLGDRVRAVRKALGMNIAVAAESIGIGVATLSKVENGGNPRRTTKKKIEDWLQENQP